MQTTQKISFVGFGEAANAFVTGWSLRNAGRIHAYDIKTDRPETRDAKRTEYETAGVTGTNSLQEALQDADMVFSVVTADQAENAAAAGAAVLSPGTVWFDCNSCAPDTKRRAAALIEAAGGRYIDVAVMAPVHPKLHHVPLKIAGPYGVIAADLLRGLDMRPEIVGAVVGQASSIKMIRSVMIKGLEALTSECLLAARRAGVEEAVLQSLESSDPDIKWRQRGAYNLERMMVHGHRRAAEVREVAITLADLGLPNRISSAVADWQDQIADLALEPGEAELFTRLDRVLEML